MYSREFYFFYERTRYEREHPVDFGMGHITTKTLSEMIKIGSIFETIWFQI